MTTIKFGLTLIFAFCCQTLFAQFSFQVLIKDSSSSERLSGVVGIIQNTNLTGMSNQEGILLIQDIPLGEQILILQLHGYPTKYIPLLFPLEQNFPLEILMSASNSELEEIIVEGTRSNRSISQIPTRVEVLTEEIDEASTMDPSKIAHLLTHSTGIQVQQTSATSNISNVRIQGLDGRYAQILKDGFPLYGGYSGSLSITQIPPLDLRQVEYIKGSASTLYGGGAISGLINLISKEPTNENLIHLNASNIGALDLNAYVARKINKWGFSLLAQRNTHQLFDADGDLYSDMPQLSKYNLNPKLVYAISNRTHLMLAGTLTFEERTGGDLEVIKKKTITNDHFYKERNDVFRITTQFKLEHNYTEETKLVVKNSISVFKRELDISSAPLQPLTAFDGKQISSFSELALIQKKGKNVLIGGLNFYTDDFKEQGFIQNESRNESNKTVGVFANYTFDYGELLSVESGFRADYVGEKHIFLLPRIATLFKWSPKFTTRIGGGLGYRNPTIFNPEAEIVAYQNILPIDKTKERPEKSYGGNADIGYKTLIGENLSVHFNQMFFYTHLKGPVILVSEGTNFRFVNAKGYTSTYGGETFFKLGFYDFVLFTGYTYTHAVNHFDNEQSPVTLTPKHSIKGDLLYSLPKKWRIAADYEYKSQQPLSNATSAPSFWTFGFLIEYTWKQFTFFGNVENITDLRQTNFQSLRSNPYNTPQFTEVWAPLDGRVFNGGFKIKW